MAVTASAGLAVQAQASMQCSCQVVAFSDMPADQSSLQACRLNIHDVIHVSLLPAAEPLALLHLMLSTLACTSGRMLSHNEQLASF